MTVEHVLQGRSNRLHRVAMDPHEQRIRIEPSDVIEVGIMLQSLQRPPPSRCSPLKVLQEHTMEVVALGYVITKESSKKGWDLKEVLTLNEHPSALVEIRV